MKIVIPVLLFTLLNFWAVFFSRRTFGVCLPVTLMSAVLLAFFSQFFFRSFLPAYWILLILSLAAVPGFFLFRKREGLVSSLCSPGLYAFLVLAAMLFIADFHRHFALWDEFSHWGKMVREMLRLDSFYSVPESNLLPHKEYPPFASLFEMLWCRFSGGYSESGVTYALHILEFSMLIPPVSEKLLSPGSKRSHWILFPVFGTVILVLFLGSCDTGNIFNSIYPDFLISLMFSYSFFLFFFFEVDTGWGYAGLLVSVFSLMLVKQVCIAFAALIWLYFTLESVFSGRGTVCLQKVIKSAVLLIAAFAGYFIWNGYAKSFGIQGQFDLSRIQFRELLPILLGKSPNPLQYTVYKYYVAALFSKPLFVGIVSLGFIPSALISVILLWLLSRISKEKSSGTRLISLSVTVVVGYLGYAFLMLVMYMFCFSEREMLDLACYDRYLGSYVVAAFLIVFLYCVPLLKRSGSVNGAVSALLISLILFDASRLSLLFPQVLLKGDGYYSVRAKAAALEQQLPPESRILVTGSDDEWNVFLYDYYFDTLKVDPRFMSDKIIEDNVEESLRGNDYLYVYDNADHLDCFAPFNDDTAVSADKLYEIASSGELTELQLEVENG